ncbi:MAG: DUF4143 domain-containing protein [Euryarchaeota archaeon]|nr:DUF4143 domain-containing protein [Euryarchaeota archaeon]
MLKGGFPEIIEEKSLDKIQKYLRTNIDKIIFQDIPKVFDIKEPALLIEILKITAAQSGTILEYECIGKSLKTTRQSISNYMLYLQESFLIRKMMNYTQSTLFSARKAKKFTIQDHGITNMLLEKHEEAFFEQESGKIMENIIVNMLQPTYFWHQNYAVDIVLKTDNITPIEIKYRTDPTDIKGLRKFMELYGIKKGIVISKTLLKQTTSEHG